MTRPAATADAVDTDDPAMGDAGFIPPDTFAARVAIVRAHLRMNYDQLSRKCGELEVPIHSEQFRRWEHGTAQCKNPRRVADVLARIQIPNTENLPPTLQHFSARWILYGGPMPPERIADAPGDQQDVLDHWRELSHVA